MSDLQSRLAGIQVLESLIVITDGDARFEIEQRTDTFFASIYEAVGLPFETGQIERTTQTLGMDGGDKLYPTNNFLPRSLLRMLP